MSIQARVTAAFDKIEAAYPEAIQTGSIQQPTPTASGGGPSDPTGGTAGTPPDPIPARMAVFPMSLSSNAGRVDGTNILATDFQVIVEPIATAITENDRIICSEGELVVIQLGKYASGGVTHIYDMVCRG